MAEIGAAIIIAKTLTELLNVKIDKMTVFDEMFLIEHGQCGADKVLNKYIVKIMSENMTPTNKKSKRLLKKQLQS